jgi:hypothetical protein
MSAHLDGEDVCVETDVLIPLFSQYTGCGIALNIWLAYVGVKSEFKAVGREKG